MASRSRGAGQSGERLSREAVARAAITLADTEGLEALTIRRLATGLGVTPMALYWHFKDKDALFDGIVEALLDDVRLPSAAADQEPSQEPTQDRAWDEQLREILAALAAVLAAHPAVAPLVKGRMLGNGSGCEITERVLDLLRQAGLSQERSTQLAVYALLFITGLVSGMPGLVIGKSEEEREQEVRESWAALQALPPKRFPRIVESAGPLTDCGASDEWLDYGLGTLMAGIRGQAAGA